MATLPPFTSQFLFPLEGLTALLNNVPIASKVSSTGTSGTNTLTVAAGLALYPGQYINGTGITPGTYISAYSGTTLTLSANLTTTNTGFCYVSGFSRLYAGLFTTSWSTIENYTGTININLNGTGNTVAELSSTGYSRVLIDNTTEWSAVSSSSTTTIGGNTITIASTLGAGVSFANTSGSSWTAVNGFFIAAGPSTVGDKSVSQGGATTVLWYGQFSDGQSVVAANNDTIVINPTWAMAPYPA